MILLKILLLIVIFSICTSIGILHGRTFSIRLENLIYLEQCIKILETEIVYGSTPLPQALMNINDKGNPRVSFIFQEIRNDLLKYKRGDIYLSFISVREILSTKLNFKKVDVETFMSLGRVLGTSNREDQEKSLKITLNQIAGLILEAKEERNKNEKLYKTLGLITGIGIIIILV